MLRVLCVVTALSAACHTYAYQTFRDPTPRSELVKAEMLKQQPAVRHRYASHAEAIVVGSDLFAGPSKPPVADVLTAAEPAEPEKLVVEVWMRIQSADVGSTAAAVRARVEADGGRVVSENSIGAGKAASSAALQLRVPPATHAGFLDWLAGLGVVESRRMLASDVGKTLFDQELALKNLNLTMTRLQVLAGRDVPIKELLEIEKEMTRVRGEIETIEGERRWLLDRVAFATISLTLEREGGPVDFAPEVRVHPGPRLSTLVMLDADGGPRSRIGGGVTIQFHRALSFDLDVFPRRAGTSRAAIATLGTALYSAFLGNGRRRWLNPYLGARAGYGYLADQHAVVLAGELGLELYKHRYLLVETAARAVAFIHDRRADVALHAFVDIAVPF